MKKIIVLADGRIVKADKIREVYIYGGSLDNCAIKAEYDNGDTTVLCMVLTEEAANAVAIIARFLVNDEIILNLTGEEINEQVQVEGN